VFRVDGHRVDILLDVFQQAMDIKGKPAVVVADTVKGKGVSFMEGEKDWHGKAPNPGQLEEALKQLQAV
jgi:transketolase